MFCCDPLKIMLMNPPRQFHMHWNNFAIVPKPWRPNPEVYELKYRIDPRELKTEPQQANAL